MSTRAHIVWEDFDASGLDAMVLGYFDQLAVQAPYRAGGWPALLAARPMSALLDAGCTNIFATTVREPVTNRAAWSLLSGLGARRVGRARALCRDRRGGLARLALAAAPSDPHTGSAGACNITR